MEKKNEVLIFAVALLSILVLILGGYIIYDKVVVGSDKTTETIREETTNTEENNQQNEEILTNSEINNNSEEHNDNSLNESKKDYSNFIGKWYNSTTKNQITIKNITENEITFTWFLYRLAGVDDDTTISLNNGKAIFYYQGYDDNNFDEKLTEDEKYLRKTTIVLTDNNGVKVIVEDVTSYDDSYRLLEEWDFLGSDHIKAGIYTHPEKIS